MQHSNESNQAFMNFNFPKYEVMTPDKFEEYVKQSFNLDTQPQPHPQTQPQPQNPNNFTYSTQSIQPTQPTQTIRPACLGATGPTQNNISFGDAMSKMKKEKEKKEVIESLYAELSSIRSQIESLTKATDNIYRIITKL